MFQEEEPGKPQNWCCTITVIAIISLINLAVFVVIRVLLDTENEFDEPVVQGKLREDLTQFLGIFSLTFCFGCWCCFCCTGNCLKCFVFLNPKRWKLAQCWSNLVSNHFVQTTKTRMQTIRRKNEKEEKQLELDHFSTMENGCRQNASRDGKAAATTTLGHTATLRKTSSIVISEVHFGNDLEQKVPSFRGSSSTSSNGGKPLEMEVGKSSRRRPTTLLADYGGKNSQTAAKTFLVDGGNLGEGQQKQQQQNDGEEKLPKQQKLRLGAERVRRWSVAPASFDALVTEPALERRWDGRLVRGDRHHQRGVVAVRDVDFIQIPIQMMTPTTVAIVDRGKLNQAYDEMIEERPTPLSPIEPEGETETPKDKHTK